MTGIRKTPQGWQAYVRVRGRLYSKRFPSDTAIGRMTAWREDQRYRVRHGTLREPGATTLAQDVRFYLEQVQSMPTIEWRKTDLARWIRVLGADRDRKGITPGEIRAQLERWKADGYSASTLNHRRTALMHLFTVLDGKSAPNPARDVPRYREQARAPRALSPVVIQALLDAMPESLTKRRLELMAWTGWPHAQIRRLQPDDIAWNRAVRIQGRLKGEGMPDVWLPLLPQGWKALRKFKQAGAWGNFSTSSMRKTLRLAADVLQHPDKRHGKDWRNPNQPARPKIPKVIAEAVQNITPYDLRHSFLTLAAVLTKNPRAVQMLGLHNDPRTSYRYTAAADDPVTRAAIAQMARLLKTG